MHSVARHFLSVLFLQLGIFTLAPAQAVVDSLLPHQQFDQGLELYRAQDYNEAMSLFKNAAQLHLELKDTSYVLYNYKFVGACLIQLEKLREFLEYRPLLMPLLKANDEEVPATLTLLGTAAMSYGDFSLAHSYFDSALTRASTLDSLSPLIQFNIGSLYLNQGRLFLKEGDFDRSLLNFQHALGIFADSTLPEPGRFYARARSLHNIGHAHELKGDYTKALHYNDLVDIELESHPHKTIKIQNLNNQGISHRHLGNSQAALRSFREELQLQNPDDSKRGRTLKQIGETFIAMHLPDSAQPYLEEALTFRKQEYGDLPHPNMSKLLVLLGDQKMQKGNSIEALEWYQLAQSKLCLPFSSPDTFGLPFLRQILFPIDLLPVFQAKAFAQEALYTQTSEVAHLYNALATYQLADSTLDVLRRSLDLEGSKLTVSGKSRVLFEGGIRVALQLFELDQDPKWLEEAFHFAEKNRATLLKESVRQAGGKNTGLIPDSLLDQQRTISLEISNLRKDLSKLSPSQIAGDSLSRQMESQLFETQLRLDSIREAITQSHPSFQGFLNNSSTPRASEVRKLLAPDQSLIEYFIGDSAVYAICINHETLKLFNLGNPNKIRDEVKGMREITHTGVEDKPRFIELAQSLYSQLIAPINNAIHGKRLVIVPDGLLHFLPFELLLSEVSSPNQSYRNLPYLLRSWAISYQFSCGLMLEKARLAPPSSVTQWVGFSPSYSEKRSGLTPLAGATKEINAIGEQYPDAQILRGRMAKKSAFLNLMDQGSPPNIAHLACHAKAGSNQESGSWIAFSDESPDDCKLTLEEIYHLSSAPEFIVLSACETGTGRLAKAEGAMSLARGFYLSGSQTILNSMWKIRDGSSQFLMEEFYRQIDGAQSLDVALQQATLAYLNSEDFGEAYMSPHFWAGFRITGAVKPFGSTGSGNLIWWILGIIGVILVIGTALATGFRKFEIPSSEFEVRSS